MFGECRYQEQDARGRCLGVQVLPFDLSDRQVYPKAPVRRQGRFIKLATYPAPNPLSILTTVTLLAQLFSIPSSAATP